MAGLIRENIDRWFEINLDVDNRTLFMGSIHNDIESGESGVDSSMAEYFIYQSENLRLKYMFS